LFREIQLDSEQWENISENSRRFYEYNHSKEDKANRESVIREIMPSINMIISFFLTARQLQVMSLYIKAFNQTTIAKILGIAQSTVSQHLNGKRRNGKKIGGSFRRIRKIIHKNANSKNWPYKDKRILLALDLLRDKNITRRRAANILDSIVDTSFNSS
jgi:FixJ family two-component response regulator